MQVHDLALMVVGVIGRRGAERPLVAEESLNGHV
jgi:hypothetical protein